VASKLLRDFLDEDWEFEVPTSFIDCVFLLLIFFILTAKFKTMERKLDADLPKNEGQNPIPKKVEQPNEIRVKIAWKNSAGQVISSPKYGDPNDVVRGASLSVSGAHISILANKMPCADLNDLARKLADLGARNPGMPVVIDARQKVPFKWVLGTLDACARAQISNVKFQAPPVEGGGGDDWWWK
jgi:biopolymer transport protein ExbD